MSNLWFSNCDTIAEVYARARELKDAGEDAGLVNTKATIKKKELITATSQINTLERIVPRASSRQSSKVSSIILQVDNLNSGVITITKSNKVII